MWYNSSLILVICTSVWGVSGIYDSFTFKLHFVPLKEDLKISLRYTLPHQ